MPYAAPRICGLCGGVHRQGDLCAIRIRRDQERKKAHDAKRPSARERGYTSAWDKARKAFLNKHPRCAVCGARATVVDHIKPHRGDRRLFWDSSNWQSLCAHHHNSMKQSQERRSI